MTIYPKNHPIILCVLICLLVACKPDGTDPIAPEEPSEEPSELQYSLGWAAEDNPDEVQTSIQQFGYLGNGNLPSSVDLTDKLPPIGDQGSYGTCVAWAAGYNVKTAVEAIDYGWSSSQLRSASHQLSPKDFFSAIPYNLKGANCNTTNFKPALDVLLQRGVATMQTVPYDNLNGCESTQSSWDAEAANHKIRNYRRIDRSIVSIKQQLANNNPVLLGAKLADNFMTWRTSEVLSSHTTTYQVGEHAGHAMAIIGYDDTKGANGAFRVVNSWGESWGDRGFIWVDYNFLVGDFCLGGNLYIVENEPSTVAPPKEQTTTAGVDLAAWVFADRSDYQETGDPTARYLDYNVYNIGSATAKSSDQWAMYYVYYDAYDANNYGVLFYDEYTNSIPNESVQCVDELKCLVNFSLPAGTNLAERMFGEGSPAIRLPYYVPETLNGEYYLLLIVDAVPVYEEADERNNFFYTTQYPINFQDGYAPRKRKGASTPIRLQDFSFNNDLDVSSLKDHDNIPNQSAVNEKHRNAYSSEEIMNMLRAKKQSGELQQKIDVFRGSKSDRQVARVAK